MKYILYSTNIFHNNTTDRKHRHFPRDRQSRLVPKKLIVELVRISTKDLNRHLKSRNIDKNRQKEIKARRRTLTTLLSRFVLQPRESFIIIMKTVTDIFLICNTTDAPPKGCRSRSKS